MIIIKINSFLNDFSVRKYRLFEILIIILLTFHLKILEGRDLIDLIYDTKEFEEDCFQFFCNIHVGDECWRRVMLVTILRYF